MKRIADDIKQGADIIMVKPAHTYLDVILRAKQMFPKIPLAVYQVSGEYMMLKLLAAQGLINEKKAFEETFEAFKRAGADYIITYEQNKLTTTI